MRLENVDFFARLVRLCVDLRHARALHCRILQSGQLQNRYLANLVVEMYGRVGGLSEARVVFSTIQEPNLFSWTIMFNACAQNGDLDEAREIFDGMPQKDLVAWNAMVQAYADNGDLQEARRLFDTMLNRNVITWTTMLAAYAEQNDSSEPEKFFDRMPVRSTVSWNAMLSAYSRKGQSYESWCCFERIPERDVISWDALLGAYDDDVKMMKIAFDRMPQQSDISCTVMIAGFAGSKQPEEARRVFDMVPEEISRCVVLKTAMLEAYARNDQLDQAQRLFEEMGNRNVVTWNSFCGGLADAGRISEAKILFGRMPGWSSVSWNVILQAFSGSDEALLEIFDRMPQRTALSWTGIVTGYAYRGSVQEARRSFDLMPLQNLVSWIVIVVAYARKGLMIEAASMFGRFPQQDALAWTTVVQAYALIGFGKQALEEFFKLDLEGIELDSETFAAILTACSHTGLLEEAHYYFWAMLDRGLIPKLKHYSIIVDVLGRSGRLSDAEELLESMPYEPHCSVWTSLLGACKTQEDPSRAKRAASQLSELRPGASAVYSLLSSISAVC